MNNLSEHNLVAPYKFIGAAALSVDNAITFLTSADIEASIIFCAPMILVLTNSPGFTLQLALVLTLLHELLNLLFALHILVFCSL